MRKTLYGRERLAVTALLLLGVLFLPLPFTALFLVYAYGRFHFFIEGVVLALCFDLLYQTSWRLPISGAEHTLSDFFLAFSTTLLSLGLFIVIEWLKEYIVLGDRRQYS